MLNIDFDKIRPWVRHIGSPCKLIDYLKIVEFYTLKTSQFKKRNNVDSKTYSKRVQYLHRPRMFCILKYVRQANKTNPFFVSHTTRVRINADDESLAKTAFFITVNHHKLSHVANVIREGKSILFNVISLDFACILQYRNQTFSH